MKGLLRAEWLRPVGQRQMLRRFRKEGKLLGCCWRVEMWKDGTWEGVLPGLRRRFFSAIYYTTCGPGSWVKINHWPPDIDEWDLLKTTVFDGFRGSIGTIILTNRHKGWPLGKTRTGKTQYFSHLMLIENDRNQIEVVGSSTRQNLISPSQYEIRPWESCWNSPPARAADFSRPTERMVQVVVQVVQLGAEPLWYGSSVWRMASRLSTKNVAVAESPEWWWVIYGNLGIIPCPPTRKGAHFT